MKYFIFCLALLIVGCGQEEIEIHDKLMYLSNEVTKVEVAWSSQNALRTNKPKDVAQAFIITSAFLLGKSETPEAQCISKAVSLSGGPSAMIEIASKAFLVGSSAWDVASSQGRQFKSLDKLDNEVKNGTSNPTWLEEYQIERKIVLDAINSMYDDNGQHVLNKWLVCTKG